MNEKMDSSVAQYFAEMARYPLLSHKEQLNLAFLIREKGDEAARQKMILHNLRLVVSAARAYRGLGLDFLDMVQAGNIGLMKAVEKFDWRKGCHFSTYATWWIKQTITRELTNRGRTIRLPVYARDLWMRITQIRDLFIREFGREPSPEEIAERVSRPLSVVRNLMRRARATGTVGLEDSARASRRMLRGGEGVLTSLQVLGSKGFLSPENQAIAENELRFGLARVYSVLQKAASFSSGRDMDIFRARYGFGNGFKKMTLEETAERFGKVRQRINQIIDSIWFGLQKGGYRVSGDWLEEQVRALLDLNDLTCGRMAQVMEQDGLETLFPKALAELRSPYSERNILKPLDSRRISPDQVLAAVRRVYGIPREEFLKKRSCKAVEARRVSIFLLSLDCRMGWYEIADFLGTSYFTVRNNSRKIEVDHRFNSYLFGRIVSVRDGYFPDQS